MMGCFKGVSFRLAERVPIYCDTEKLFLKYQCVHPSTQVCKYQPSTTPVPGY